MIGDFLTSLLRWTITIPFILAAIFAFIAIINLMISLVGVTMNQSVLGDLFAMIQMWLPFNLDSLLWWFVTAAVLYVTYKLAISGYNFVTSFLGKQ